MLHRVVACNHWLFNSTLKENPNCDACEIDDTLQHFFIHCEMVTNFWNSLTRWWNRITPSEIIPRVITEVEIIFGIFNGDKYDENLNVILILAKRYIHDCKMFLPM